MARTKSRELTPVDGLAQLSFLVYGLLEGRVAERDLSMIQVRLLGVLRDRRPTMNELAQLLELDKSSVTGLVDRAASRGHVVRVPSDTDRRIVRVSLTDRGRSLAAAVGSEFEADASALLAHLPRSDRAVLSRLVRRLLVGHARAHGVDLFATIDAALIR